MSKFVIIIILKFRMNAIYEIELRSLKNAVDVRRFRIVIIYLFIAFHVIFKGFYLSILNLLFTKSPKRIDLYDDSKLWLTE